MKKWIQKAIVQKAISYLPYSHKINYLFQKYVTKGIYLTDDYFFDRLEHARDHLKTYSNYTDKPIPETCLEVGTGWYPVVPISFFLTGTAKVYSVDISFLTSKERIAITLLKFVESNNSGKLAEYITVIPQRVERIKELLDSYGKYTLKEVLDKLNIIYLIEDARQLTLADNSIDLVNSNNTFEHIYPEILVPILREFSRVVKKEDGIMSHFIDMSDHFAHFDKSITVYNFLQFSSNQWKWIDNSIQPQSRLRMFQYQKIFSDLKIPLTHHTFRKGNLKELNSVILAKEYSDYAPDEIAISHCHFVSKMKIV